MYLSSSERTGVLLELMRNLEALVDAGNISAAHAFRVAVKAAHDHTDWPDEPNKSEPSAGQSVTFNSSGQTISAENIPPSNVVDEEQPANVVEQEQPI